MRAIRSSRRKWLGHLLRRDDGSWIVTRLVKLTMAVQHARGTNGTLFADVPQHLSYQQYVVLAQYRKQWREPHHCNRVQFLILCFTPGAIDRNWSAQPPTCPRICVNYYARYAKNLITGNINMSTKLLPDPATLTKFVNMLGSASVSFCRHPQSPVTRWTI